MNNTELRALMARMQEQVTRSAEGASAENGKALEGAWANLSQHLAVGPAPDTRDCPACGKTVMTAATVCGYCWTKLSGSHPGTPS